MSKKLAVAAQLGDLTDEEGRLERPLADERWSVPDEVDLVGDRLVYRWTGRERSASSGFGILSRFVDLADAADAQILSFARRWGVMELCEHGLPAAHSRPALAPSIMHRVTWCERLGHDPGKERQDYWEPLSAWRQFSREGKALLTLAAHLQSGTPSRPEDWRVALGWERTDGGISPPAYPPDWKGREWHIEQRVNTWMAWGASGLSFHWRRSWPPKDERATTRPRESRLVPEVTVGGGGLFGALAAQLMFAVARSDGLAFCSGCTTPFFPTRKPSSGERRYCDDCRTEGVPQRDATRDYSNRQRRGEATEIRSATTARGTAKPRKRSGSGRTTTEINLVKSGEPDGGG